MSHPLHAADDEGEQDKPAQTQADVKEIKHCGSSVSVALKLDPMPVKMPFEIGLHCVKTA